MINNRRNFLKFLGQSGILLAAAAIFPTINGCKTTVQSINSKNKKNIAPNLTAIDKKINPLPALLEDKLILAEGLAYQLLLSWGDKTSDNDSFGTHCDYLAFIPLDDNNPNDGLLWANHEYLNPLFIHGNNTKDFKSKSKSEIAQEMYSVGGSITRVKKNERGEWQVVYNDKHNRRISGLTKIPFANNQTILNSKEAMGTFGNCAGGVTPWGTVLTCEENYDMFYGETDYSDSENPKHIPSYAYGWDLHNDNPPEHYGWVVEIDLKTGDAKKHVSLGRCAHECATCVALPDGRVVVYTGDDANSEHLYKFISDKPNSLATGILYVADTINGRWLSLDYSSNPALQKKFKNQTEVLIRLREAAKIVGATPLDRPEDIDINPLNGHVYITVTNNKPKGNYTGSILKIAEDNQDHSSLTFKSETFLAGGVETGFACPDNICFDKNGNLWFASDISGEAIGKNQYENFGNNGIFFVPATGQQAGKVIKIASAPNDAEFTGLFFSPDYKTLFVSVQHPGELTKDLKNPTSRFPDYNNNLPKSAVVAISGQLLNDVIL
jgi:uncharacterized protein